MIAVIFEVELAGGQRETYLEIAANLKSRLEGIDGFLSVERFQSVTQANKLLSLSFFKDEQALAQWRQSTEHRMAQQQGRMGIFTNYRLHVAEVSRRYGMNERMEAPSDSARFHAID